MDYSDIYKKNKTVFSNNPTLLLKRAAEILINKKMVGNFLDIGAGQGQDTLYMADLGFNVLATDINEEACRQIIIKSKSNGNSNIEVENVSLEKLTIKDNFYDIISCINVLHFLEKKVALAMIEKIKKGLDKDGLAVITLFILKNGFQEKELLNAFDGYEIIHYFEAVIEDKGHPGQPKKHTHHVARIIAKKN